MSTTYEDKYGGLWISLDPQGAIYSRGYYYLFNLLT